MPYMGAADANNIDTKLAQGVYDASTSLGNGCLLVFHGISGYGGCIYISYDKTYTRRSTGTFNETTWRGWEAWREM